MCFPPGGNARGAKYRDRRDSRPDDRAEEVADRRQHSLDRLRLRTCCRSRAADIPSMKMKVIVTPKAAVLDPQGAAVCEAMQHLGMPEVRNVRIGKYLEIEVDGDQAVLEAKLHQLCHDLLSNPVIEDYQLSKGEAKA